MKKQIYSLFIELLAFMLSFILLLKAFYFAEAAIGESFINFIENPVNKIILFAIVLISMLFSGYIASKYKLTPIKFMQTDKQAKTINIKKLVKQKEGLFIIILALFFCLTYNNLMHLNNYSQQALLLVLIFYCPISTILQINKRKK